MPKEDLANEVKRQLTAWGQTVADDIGALGVYLFGSLVYKSGAQFGPGSDVDLVVLFPTEVMDALARMKWLERLLAHKVRLEGELSETLKLNNPDKPICSVVVCTSLDVAANVHKDNAPGFYSENLFLNLLTGSEQKGLTGAGSKKINDRLVSEPLRFAQKKRNEFLAVSANGTGGIAPYEGTDPVPKDVMRYAALAAHEPDGNTTPGAEYDTQHGLDFLTIRLYELRGREAVYRELQHWLSIRRGARGEIGPLPPSGHMLLVELIYDTAIKRLAKETESKSLPSLRGRHSTVFFSDRFAQAFPGVRDIKWFDDEKDIAERLKRLLEPPLVYSDGTPVWWWRDGNLHIEIFQHLSNRLYLMDVCELSVRRIAAVHPGPYYCDFVYVEVEAMPPTGLYEHTETRIAEELSGNGYFGYYWEEYGLVDGVHLIKRAELDDGAAVINGDLQDIRGRNSLRVRYVTPYNFVIAAHGSPINNVAFDRRLKELLNAMLKGEDRLGDLQKEVLRLPKRAT
jgi:predicted nucleotidyltransferase